MISPRKTKQNPKSDRNESGDAGNKLMSSTDLLIRSCSDQSKVKERVLRTENDEQKDQRQKMISSHHNLFRLSPEKVFLRSKYK